MTTYYVAKTGSDGNPGTSASPKLTVNAGIGLLASLDALEIRGGTYTEGITNTIPSGNASARTVIRGAPGQTVVLNGSDGNGDAFSIGSRSYITLDNLTFDGVNGFSFALRLGFGGAEVSYIDVLNSIIKNGAHSGLYTGGTGGLNHHLLFKNLTAFNSGFNPGVDPLGHGIYLTGADNIIEDCTVYGNASHGVHIYGTNPSTFSSTSRNTVRRCRLHGNASFGLMLSSGSDNLAYNNLIYVNGYGFRFYDGAVNNKFFNNTVYANTLNGIWVQGGSGGLVKNNIAWQNGTNYQDSIGGATQDHNLLGIDPLFVDAANADFRRRSGSPATDTGLDLSAYGFTTDFFGNIRS